MSLKQYYTSETEIPTELKNFYAGKNGRFEIQIEGFESVPAVFDKNTELINRQTKDASKIQELEAKAGQVNTLTQQLADKNSELSRLSSENLSLQSKAVPTGYAAVAKKDAELLEKLKKQNLDVEKLGETLAEVETVKAENAEFKLEKAIAAFAETEKVGGVKALTRLIKQDGVQPLIKEEGEGDKKVKKGYLVKTIDGNPVETSYADYKSTNWSEFASALDGGVKAPKGNGYDPKPQGFVNDTDAEKAAQSGQARAIHNNF
jgi:hypothetical protein